MKQISEAAKLLKATPGVKIRKATVTQVNSDATIRIKFSADEPPVDYDIPHLTGDEPAVGQDVWIQVQGSMMLCIGNVSTTWSSGIVRGARLHRSADQTGIVTSTITPIAFNAETFDTNNLHDNVTNNTRLLLDQVGKWLVSGMLRFSAGATGIRQAMLRLNGTTYFMDPMVPNLGGSLPTSVLVNDIIVATAITDYVEMLAWHNQGSNLSALGGIFGTSLTATYLGT